MIPQIPISLDRQGYFVRGEERIIPVGASYWPASCGFQMWREWPETEIKQDLDYLVSLSMNTVRFFLRWEDFEPAPEQYSAIMFDRLTMFLDWCQTRGLFAQVVIFTPVAHATQTGPAWKGDRNFYSDPFMLQRSLEFARKVAATCAPYAVGMLGFDIGHNLSKLPDCDSASPATIRKWSKDIASALRAVCTSALVTCGNGIDQITKDTGWRLGEIGGCQYQTMHGSNWPSDHCVNIDGMMDAFSHSLIPFYTEIARSFGPVMLQDISIRPSIGGKQPEAFLRSILNASWDAGANGFLWCLLRDIPTIGPASTHHPINGNIGLLDETGAVKPGLQYFVDFAHTVAELGRPRISTNFVGIYLPKHFYPRDNPENCSNTPVDVIRSAVMANYHLRKIGYETHIVRGDKPINPRLRTIFVTGANLRPDEAVALTEWVESGGRLIWHGPDPLNWGPEYCKLLGARPVDYRAATEVIVPFNGLEWKFDSFPRNLRVQVDSLTCNFLASDDRGVPVVLRNSLGTGAVICALPKIDESAAAITHLPLSRDRCTTWYEGMLRA